MSAGISARFRSRSRRATIGLLLAGIVGAANVRATPFNSVVLVPPADLPISARQGGEAMFLYETPDGRVLLYVEQNQGAQLAIFEVTDPAHVKSEKSAQLDAAGPFDFVVALGERAELVRFRDGHGDAVLDLHGTTPVLRKIQGLELQNATPLLGSNGLRVAGPVIDAPSAENNGRDYQVFEKGKSPAGDSVIEVKQVRQEAINGHTGTTFLLSEKGLYLIRRPALETVVDMYGGR